MAEEGKDEDLFKRIAGIGLQLEYDSGFLVVTRSASDQRRDDDGEVEAAFLETMGKHLREVSSFAVGKARDARATRDFVGQRVFVPSIQVFGKLSDCTEGIVRVSYRRPSFKDENVDVQLIHSGHGDDLLIIVADERPPASETSFTWIADERLRRLFVRAAQAGLRLEHAGGFTIVNLRAVQGVERKVAEGIIQELGAKRGLVSFHLAARARGEGRGFRRQARARSGVIQFFRNHRNYRQRRKGRSSLSRQAHPIGADVLVFRGRSAGRARRASGG